MELIDNETTRMVLLMEFADPSQQPSADILIGPNPQYIYFRDTVRFWVQRVLVPLIMVIGIVGNTITILIMTRRRMRSSTNWYLAALAIFDMIYLIFTFILSLQHYPNAHHIDYYLYWYLFPFTMMITDASSNTSVWLTVTFTIERYIAVCHPIKGKVICTESRAKRVILCVFIICLSVTVPTPFEWVVVKEIDQNTNQTSMEATFSELGQNVTYKNIYYHLNVFLFILLPLVLLVIFNTFLIRSVHLSTKQRNQMVMAKDNYKSSNNHSSTKCSESTSSSSSRQEIRITIMLIAVVILFIICQTPTACILIYTSFYQYEPNSNLDNLLRMLSNIFNFLMSINAAGNFVLYCLLSQKYRRTFVNMFCPCLAAKYLNTKSTYTRTNYESIAAHSASNQSHHSFHPSSAQLHLNHSPSQYNNNRINRKYSTNGINFNDPDSIMTTTLNNSNVSVNNNNNNNNINDNNNNDHSSFSNESLNHLTVSSCQTVNNCDKVKYLNTENSKGVSDCDDGDCSNSSSPGFRTDHLQTNFVLEKTDFASIQSDHSKPLVDHQLNSNQYPSNSIV